jgi:hypothetical protein
MGWLARLAQSVRGLAGLGDGPMGPSPRVIYIYKRYSSPLVHHLDQPTGQPTESRSRAPDRLNPARPHVKRSPRACVSQSHPACPREPNRSRVSRLPLRAQSRSTLYELKHPRAPRPTRVSHFPFPLSHFMILSAILLQ